MVTRRRATTLPERTVNVAVILVTRVKRAFRVNAVEPAFSVRLKVARVFFFVCSRRAVLASTVSVAVTGQATAQRALTRIERLPEAASVNVGLAGAGAGVAEGAGVALGATVAAGGAVGVAVGSAVGVAGTVAVGAGLGVGVGVGRAIGGSV
jgi:hypothetical protein